MPKDPDSQSNIINNNSPSGPKSWQARSKPLSPDDDPLNKVEFQRDDTLDDKVKKVRVALEERKKLGYPDLPKTIMLFPQQTLDDADRKKAYHNVNATLLAIEMTTQIEDVNKRIFFTSIEVSDEERMAFEKKNSSFIKPLKTDQLKCQDIYDAKHIDDALKFIDTLLVQAKDWAIVGPKGSPPIRTREEQFRYASTLIADIRSDITLKPGEAENPMLEHASQYLAGVLREQNVVNNSKSRFWYDIGVDDRFLHEINPKDKFDINERPTKSSVLTDAQSEKNGKNNACEPCLPPAPKKP